MIAERVRSALKIDIAAHLVANGSRNWKIVREKYPDISEASFWRVVGAVKRDQGGALRVPPSDAELAPLAPTQAEIGVLVSEHQIPRMSAGLPARALAEAFARTLADVEKLRKYSVDENGEVINPRAFAESIKLRESLLSKSVFLLRELNDVTQQQELLDIINHVVVDLVPPDTQLAIIKALAAVNSRNLAKPPSVTS